MTTATTTPDLAVTRVFSAPRALVYRAFTDPEQFAQWWGPTGNHIPRDEMDFEVRSGGHQRWTEVYPDRPGAHVRVDFDLAQVVDNELIDGTFRVMGRLPGGFEPFETKVRIEFHDEANGRTRIEVRQWLAEHLVSPSENGWAEAFAKLDAVLAA